MSMNCDKAKMVSCAAALFATVCASAETVNIPANGGVIQYSPNDAVVINEAGSGNDGITLGAASVAVSNITQNSATPATVHVNAGQTLTVNGMISLASGMEALSFLGEGVIKGGNTTAPAGGYGLNYLQNNPSRKRLHVGNRNTARTLTIGVMPGLFDDGDDGAYIYRHRDALCDDGGTGPVVFQVEKDWINPMFFVLRNGTNYVRGTGLLLEGVNNRLEQTMSVARETVSAETQLPTSRPVLVYDGCNVKGAAYSSMRVGDTAGTGTVIFRNGARYDNGSPSGDSTHVPGAIMLGCGQSAPTESTPNPHKSLGTMIVEGDETDVRCCFRLGQNRGNGVLVQKGGTLRPWHSYAEPVIGGYLSYGYLELVAGILVPNGWIRVGSGDSDSTDHTYQSTGLIVQRGGDFQSAQLMMGSGKNALAWFVQRGGTFTSTGSRLSGENHSNKGVCSGFIVDGEGKDAKPVATFNHDCCLGRASNAVTHVVVKGGGVLAAYSLQKDTDSKAEDNGAKMYVSIDGGTLRARTSVDGTKSGFFGEAAKPLTSVTVYSGGLTFDTDGKYTNLRVPLAGPSGSGIASIEVPNELKAANVFLGAPLVVIEGDGEGASAYCDWDYDTKTLNGIRIASPGCNYTTATAKLVRGGQQPGASVVLDCTLTGPQTGGGLVKIGTGSLRLFAANTYHGDLVVSNGTIDVNSPDVIPATAAVHIMKDAQLWMPTSVRNLDFNGRLGSGGGTVSGNINNVSGWTVRVGDLGHTLTISGTLSFADGADFAIDHPKQLSGLPPDTEYTLVTASGGISGNLPVLDGTIGMWRLVKVANSIKLKRIPGMKVIIR